MPFIIPIVVGAVVSTALAVTLGATLTLGLFLTHLALHAVSYLLARKAAKGNLPTPEDTGYEVSSVQPAAPMALIYGRAKVGGIIVFKSVNDENGDKSDTLKTVITYAGHEIEGFEKFFFDEYELELNGSAVVTEPFDGVSNIYTKLGTTNQTAVTELVNSCEEWTTNHRLRGRAYAVVSLEYNRDVFPVGEPNHRAIVKGKKIRDITKSGATAQWTDNCALCLLDYIMDDEHGLGVPESKIDKDMFRDAIEVCDQLITSYAFGPNPKDETNLYNVAVTSGATQITAPSGTPFNGSYVYVGLKIELRRGGTTQLLTVTKVGADPTFDEISVTPAINLGGTVQLVGRERRYTYNGTFTTEVAPNEALGSMTSNMIGSVWFSQGKWKVKAGAYTDPVMNFDRNDIIGSIVMDTSTSVLDNYYYVGGKFRGPISEFVDTDFSPVQNQPAYTAGNREKLDVAFNFCDSPFRAQRMAKTLLQRTLEPVQFEAIFNMKAYQISVGDIIRVSDSSFGWDNKTFEVLEWNANVSEEYGLHIKMICKEITAIAYDWNLSEQYDFNANNTNNSNDPYSVPAISLTVESVYRTINNQEVPINIATIQCNEPSRVDVIQLEHRETGVNPNDPWVFAATSPIEENVIVVETSGFVVGVSYDFRARGVNTLGVKGPWVLSDHTIDPDTRQPGDVMNFNRLISGQSIVLSWDPVISGNPQSYKIRLNSTGSSTEWRNTILIRDNIPVGTTQITVPAVVGRYYIKAVNSAGLQSENPATVNVLASDLRNFDNAVVNSENPNFPGRRFDTIVQGGDLTVPDNDLSGTYYFNGVRDINVVKNAWVSFSATIFQEKYVPDISPLDHVNARVYVAATSNAPTTNTTSSRKGGSILSPPTVGSDIVTFTTGTTFLSDGNLVGGTFTFGSGSSAQTHYIKRVLADIALQTYTPITPYDIYDLLNWDVRYSADGYGNYVEATGSFITGRAFKFYTDISSVQIGYKPDVSAINSRIEYDNNNAIMTKEVEGQLFDAEPNLEKKSSSLKNRKDVKSNRKIKDGN